ncbi:hypothetical protein JGUZn3_08410 [Entomobacter blattae]|uniref:Uncharacterized protein n=1 Tax=Entomobacter blattae TaxID=2762277 RepID=A0A7H1NQL3_9PROT|nr:hypothetical protein JGUZn3_08410 [Entomobacter blattae]
MAIKKTKEIIIYLLLFFSENPISAILRNNARAPGPQRLRNDVKRSSNQALVFLTKPYWSLVR